MCDAIKQLKKSMPRLDRGIRFLSIFSDAATKLLA
jgi:hypothetical protein